MLLVVIAAVLSFFKTVSTSFDCVCNRYNAMQSILAGGAVTLFLFALYVPWFTNPAMLAAITGSVFVNMFLMAGSLGLLPDEVKSL